MNQHLEAFTNLASEPGDSLLPVNNLPRLTPAQERHAYQSMYSSALTQLSLLTHNTDLLELLKVVIETVDEESARYAQTTNLDQQSLTLDIISLVDELETMYYLNCSKGLGQRRQRLQRRLSEWSAPHHLVTSVITRTLHASRPQPNHLIAFNDIKASLDRYHAQRNKLTTANLRLVYSIAYRFRFLGLPYEDLIQEGSLGLMKAIERYDPSKGFQFSTYAYRIISQSIHNAIDKQAHMVRKPFRQLNEKAVVDKTRTSLEQKLSRPLRGYELNSSLPNNLEYTYSHISNNIEPSANTQSLYAASTHPEDHASMDASAQDFDVQFLKHQATLDSALSRLDQRSRTVLRMRYGLGIARSFTLKEISETLSLSSERVRQIAQKAVLTLQNDLSQPANLEPLK
jgi:RNA polymerase nonessential primary-like sigma factor